MYHALRPPPGGRIPLISEDLEQALSRALGPDFSICGVSGGGHSSFGETRRLKTSVGEMFLKTMPVERFPMLEAESLGLQELDDSGCVQVPEVIALGASGENAFLLLRYLDLRPLSMTGAATLGRQLARLHEQVADNFGWSRDNFIGATPQPNRACETWTGFLVRERIGFQLELASGRPGWTRADANSVQVVMDRVEEFFGDYQPVPSLLHGDLWAGNAGELADGTPVIFDPAVYYGDREADLAMSELFGGFPAAFFDAYRETWPVDAGYARRRGLYQLYHVLNHFNLFGAGYADQARSLIRRLGQSLP